MRLQLRHWCAALGALWLMAADIDAAPAISVHTQLTSAVTTLWQEAVVAARVDHDQKTATWVLDVHSRVVGPYQQWWQFSALLDRLLGDAVTEPNTKHRQALEQVLADTMARYVFEVLLERGIDGQTLNALDVTDIDGLPYVRLTVSGPFGLPVQIGYFTEQLSGQWRVVDMMVAGVRYSEWKGHSYRERANSGDWETLLTELEAKNREFFAQFCDYPRTGAKESGEVNGQHNKPTPLPRYLAAACHP